MKKLIFIGTLHAGLTSHEELSSVLIDLNPDRLLVEITAEKIEKDRLTDCPEEMVFAVSWARKMKIPVHGFDAALDAYNFADSSDQSILEKQRKIIQDRSWKEFNQRSNRHLLSEISQALVDPDKWRRREIIMAENIARYSNDEGVTVILTGVGHLDFFASEFKNAEFPLV